MGEGSGIAVSYSIGRRCSSDLALAVAVGWASSYSPDLTPSLGTSTCHGGSPKKTKKKKKKKRRRRAKGSETESTLVVAWRCGGGS